MRSEIRARWLYCGDNLDPDEITRILGLAPTRIWRKGDTRGRTTLPTSGWQLSSALDSSVNLETHVRTLISQIIRVQDKAAILGRQYSCALACTVRSFGGDNPAIPFANDIVQFVASCNASIDVDLYIFDRETEPNEAV